MDLFTSGICCAHLTDQRGRGSTIIMNSIESLCPALQAGAVGAIANGTASHVHCFQDIDIPDDNADDVPIRADLYIATAERGAAAAAQQPLVLVMPGFAGPKGHFSQLGTGLAAAGFAAMVLSQERAVEDAPPGVLVRHT